MGCVRMVQEELSVSISLHRRLPEPAVRLLPVQFHILTGEVQLTQRILGILVAQLCSCCQIFHRPGHILGHQLSLEIQLAQPVGGILVALVCRSFIPGHRFAHPLLPLEQLAQGVLGKVVAGLSSTAEPQLRPLIVREHAHPIPPTLTQLMGGHGEAGIPELFQHTHLHRLRFLWVFVLVQNFLGISISRRQVPPGTPPYHLLLLIRLVLHLPILKGGYA